MKKLLEWIKVNWEDTLKFFLLTTVMTVGFWMIYAMIWFACGLPETNWALWSLFLAALASEYGYIKWLEN